MAFNAFLQIDGIEGECTDDKHKNWIEVLSYSTGLSQTASGSAGTAGGAVSQRADFKDFTIVKTLDNASPLIALACADGTRISSVILELCRTGGDKIKYMEYRLSNCIVSSVRPGGDSRGAEMLPLEEVSFNYGKIEWLYTQQRRADGSGGGHVAAGWDLEKNRRV
ncbi:MAG: type VI secretion system tube protein Hcp [Candidatus Scalindua sp.]|nr:type VI secretion system tube protein Hcp [Candidatus Scalindua sp.]